MGLDPTSSSGTGRRVCGGVLRGALTFEEGWRSSPSERAVMQSLPLSARWLPSSAAAEKGRRLSRPYRGRVLRRRRHVPFEHGPSPESARRCGRCRVGSKRTRVTVRSLNARTRSLAAHRADARRLERALRRVHVPSATRPLVSGRRATLEAGACRGLTSGCRTRASRCASTPRCERLRSALRAFCELGPERATETWVAGVAGATESG